MKNAKIPKSHYHPTKYRITCILIFYISSNLFLESKDQTNTITCLKIKLN
jgi:hypothetical protein